MELNKGKLKKALRKGMRYFKKVNKKCKFKFSRKDWNLQFIDFDKSIYGEEATLSIVMPNKPEADNSWWLGLEITIRKNLSISDNAFNYKHKNFFIKQGNYAGFTYGHLNFIGHEEDVTTILKAYADNMLKGDLYQEWK